MVKLNNNYKGLNMLNKIIKFKTGKTYFNNNTKITIDEIIENTIYFDDGYLSAEIKVINNVETACVTVYSSRTFFANNTI